MSTDRVDAVLIGMIRTSWPMSRDQYEKGWNEAIHAARKALASSGEAAPVDGLDDIADGVRYAGGNGTSDYWRGFNDGIDKLVAAAREEADDGRS
ncbi:MAG TPA: hypothetical protein VI341_13800 [Actinomycetota bacterium]